MSPFWMCEEWPEIMLDRMKPSDAPQSLRGTLWHSRATGRRGSVLWASGGRVCLSYDETNPEARKVMAEADLKRLYKPIP